VWTLLIIIFRSILCKSDLAEVHLLSHWVAHALLFSRWEVPIEGVTLDGQQLPASNLPGSGSTLSALIDSVITYLHVFDHISMLTFHRRATA